MGSGRKSIFAQKMAARRAAEKEATAPSAAECVQVRSAPRDALDPEGSTEEAPRPGNRDGKWKRFCLSSLLYLYSLNNIIKAVHLIFKLGKPYCP